MYADSAGNAIVASIHKIVFQKIIRAYVVCSFIRAQFLVRLKIN